VTNFQTLLAIANAVKNEPSVGPQSARGHWMQNVVAVQWELLQATNISDEELKALQAAWTNIDFIEPAKKAELMTRAIVPMIMNQGRAGMPLGGPGGTGPRMSGPFDIGGLVQSWRRWAADAFWVQSWSYDDELTLLEAYQVMVETMR